MEVEKTAQDILGAEPYRKLVEEIKDYAIFATDAEGLIVSWNSGVKRLLGYDEAEFVGQHASLIFTPEDVEQGADLEELRKAANEGRAEDTRWHLRKDGSRFWADGLVMPLRDESGSLRGFAKVMRDITERKEAEEALRQSEKEFRTLADSIPQLAWMADSEGYIFWYNRRWYDYTGTTLEEMQGWGWQKVHHPEEVGRVVERFKRAVTTGESWEDTFPLRSKDSEYRRFLSRALPIRDAGGRVVSWFGTNTDVEEQLRVEEERERLLVSEQAARSEAERQRDFIQRVLDNAPLAIGVMEGAEHRFALVNTQTERLTGVPREQFIGRPHVEVAPEADEVVGPILDRVYRTGVPETQEIEVILPNKVRAHLQVTWTPLPGTDESSRGVLYLSLDITGRKRVEEALRANQMRLALAQQAGRAGTFEWDIRRNVSVWSPELEALYGVPAGAFEGNFEAWTKRVFPEDAQTVTANLQKALDERHDEHEYEFRAVLPDGSHCWLAGRARFEYDADDSPIRMIGINVDISERKRTEEERERLLAREQEARRQAEDANRLKDEFLATLSHELRTPLTAILGWSKMLRDGQLDGDNAARALEIIQRNARSQVQLIDDLLDVSRIITGKLRLDVRPVELSSVIEAVTDAVRPAAEAKGVRLQTLLDPSASPVSGDADRLQQVVWNLVTNAVKFTPRGGRVQVRLERVNSHVEIVVSDTGRGINPEFLPHVFDRFRQADQTSTREHGGLGLGLAIVRQLVEQHGGTVEAESAGEGQGTAFTVKLPLMVTRRQVGEVERRVHPTAGSDITINCPPLLTGLRVLVVDDEPDTRDLLRAVLEHCGSNVVLAGSAAEGLELLKESKPDILLSDIGMPGEDGYVLIRQVRSLPAEQGGRIPAIALTAYARVEDRVRALTAGYQVHVPKPIEPVELMAVVASLAGRTGRA